MPVRQYPSFRIQPTLTVGHSDDPLEHEADRIADQVMRMPEPQAKPDGGHEARSRGRPPPLLQTKSVDANDSAGIEAPPIVHEVLNSPGRPLDAATRAFFEPRFGSDFSQVRVHDGTVAAASASAIGARAYTKGSSIVFAAGQYSPTRSGCRHLLAHELVHTAQRSRVENTVRRFDGEDERTRAASTFQTTAAGRATNSIAVATPHQSALLSVPSMLPTISAAQGFSLPSNGLDAKTQSPMPTAATTYGGTTPAVSRGGATSEGSVRVLTPAEVNYATKIFGNSIDFSRVRIKRYAAPFSAVTIGDNVHLTADDFYGETMTLNNRGMNTLIHELGHVWQYQHGGLSYIPKSLFSQWVASNTQGSRNAAYDWTQPAKAKYPWTKWNPEQQAECISDYTKALRRIRKGVGRAGRDSVLNKGNLTDSLLVTLALPYIELVKKGEGAPRDPDKEADKRPGADSKPRSGKRSILP